MITEKRALRSEEQTDFWGLTEQDHADALAEDAARAAAGEVDPIPMHLIDRYYGSIEAFVSVYRAQAESDDKDAADEQAPEQWRAVRRQNSDRCRALIAKATGSAA